MQLNSDHAYENEQEIQENWGRDHDHDHLNNPYAVILFLCMATVCISSLMNE